MVPLKLSTLGTVDDYDYALRDSRAVALVTDARLYDRIGLGLARSVPRLRACLVAGAAPSGATELTSALAGESPYADPAQIRIGTTWPYWLYSSGTTGQAKAVVHLHHDIGLLHRYPTFETSSTSSPTIAPSPSPACSSPMA